MEDALTKVSASARTPKQLTVYLIISLSLIGLVAGILGYQRAVQARSRILQEESVRARLGASAVQRDLERVFADFSRLAQSEAILQFLSNPSPESIAKVNAEFIHTLHSTSTYDQIRIIGIDGREKIRTEQSEGTYVSIEEQALQDKSKRHYYLESIDLPPNTLYVSQMDPNIEHGQLERPLKPVIRIAAPLIDSAGEKHGILVINYIATKTLSFVDSIMTSLHGETLIMVNDGYWIKTPHEDSMWEYYPLDQYVFSSQYPGIWAAFTQKSEAQIDTGSFLFSFTSLNLKENIGTPRKTAHTHFKYKIGNLVRRGSIQQEIINFFKENIHILILITSCAALFSAFLAMVQREKYIQISKLNQREKRYRELFEFAPEGIIISDPETGKSEINVAGKKLAGYGEEDLLNRSLFDLICDNEKDLITEFKSNLSKNKVITRSWHIEHRDGGVLPVEISAKRLYDGKIQSFIRDTSERNKIDAEMRLARTVFQNTQEGILVTDAKRLVISVNNAYTQMYGYTLNDIIGKKATLIHGHENNKNGWANAWRPLHRHGHWHGEFLSRDAGNNLYVSWATVTVVRDENGKVTNYIAIFTDISELKDAEYKLNHMAMTDSLTGLLNRNAFNRKLSYAVELARKECHKVALLFLDLDRFKLINDTLGHASGDELLKVISERLTGSVRGDDFIARLGGDEFTILLNNIGSPENAASLARKVIRTISEPIIVDDREIVTSTSIGIAIFPDDAVNPIELARAADVAMYRAKSRGRQTFEFYAPEMTEVSEQKLNIEQELRQALAKDELRLHYQPQIDIESGSIIGVEALLRWHHPEKGLLMPGSFLDVAHESQLINSIGEWVAKASCAQAQQWLESGLPAFTIAINFAGHQLMYDNAAIFLRRILSQHSLLHAQNIQLEITETLLQAGPHVVSTLHELRGMGVSVAIDDFGTGYSSLSHLKHLPIDTLKIDRSFLEGVPGSSNNAAIVRAIVSMGHSLDLTVIAEGVEQVEQLDFLRAVGCHQAQGYFFSRPVPADEIVALINRQSLGLKQSQSQGHSKNAH